jgi:hypothetical protein
METMEISHENLGPKIRLSNLNPNVNRFISWTDPENGLVQ